jgi:hypothetical protein
MELLVDLFGYLSIVVHGLTILSQSVALGGVLFLVLLAWPLHAAAPPGHRSGPPASCSPACCCWATGRRSGVLCCPKLGPKSWAGSTFYRRQSSATCGSIVSNVTGSSPGFAGEAAAV